MDRFIFFGDISSLLQMFADHVRERIKEEFKWFTVINFFVMAVMPMMQLINDGLDIFNDSLRIDRI